MTTLKCIFWPGVFVQSELEHVNSHDNNAMCEIIDKYNNYDNASKHLRKNINNYTFKKYYIKSITEAIITHSKAPCTINILKILIDKYGFVPDDEFKLAMYKMSYEMFILFLEYFEITKSIDIVQHIIYNECRNGNLDNVKQLLNMEYNINDLIVKDYNTNAIYATINWNRYHVMEYLLDAGLNFKIYEEEILKQCILNGDMKMFLLFIKYGADVNVLNNKNNMVSSNTQEFYNLLSEYGLSLFVILGLMYQYDHD